MKNKIIKIIHQNRESRALWLTVGIILILIIVMGVIKKFKPEPEPVPNGEKAVKVSVIKAVPETFTDTVLVPASVKPFHAADISAEKAGRIVEMPVDKGGRVNEGDLLLRVEDRGWKAFKDDAEVRLKDARRSFKRWDELKKTGAVSDSEYDAVKTRLEAAEITHERASFDLSQCEIKAPFSGMVDSRYLEPGEYANEAQAVLRLIDLSRVKIMVNVPERDIMSVSKGEMLDFTVSSVPGRKFSGEVVFVSSEAESAANSFEVELHCDNPDKLLKGGMIAEVTVPRPAIEDAIILPLSAVVPQKGEHVVYKLCDGKALRQVVGIGAFLDQRVLVSRGVESGDIIIVEGNRNIRDGELVEAAGDPERQE